MSMYLIWSHKHGQWWAHERQGYTDDISRAGRYSLEEVGAIVVPTIPPGSEVAVPEVVAQRHGNALVFGLRSEGVSVTPGPSPQELPAIIRAAWRVLATWDGLDATQAPDTGDAETDIGPYRDSMDAALAELRAAIETHEAVYDNS